VATATGAVSGTASDLTTDLGAVDDALQKRAAPLAVTATAASATPVPVAISYKVWLYNTSGLSPAQIKAAIAARLVAFMSGQPIGGNVIGLAGKVFLDAIRTVIGAALPQIFHVEIVLPAADVGLTIGQVPVLGAVTAVAVTQVPPSEGLL
jgi:hypothetical protein